MRTLIPALLASITLLAVACADDSPDAANDSPVIDPGDAGVYAPVLDPADFVERIDNPLLPFVPGSHWVYQSDDGVERIEVTVLEETRIVIGIAATVVHDVVSEDGEVIEDTMDWYAQDRDGNVWYLGEDSKELEDGQVVSTHGSWEAGVDGAYPGIVMHAAPEIGRGYRQEYYAGEAEDMAEALRLDGDAQVPLGSYDRLLVTQEWTPLDPGIIEHKYYASNVGMVLEVAVSGGTGRVELVEYQAAGS